MSRSGSIPSPDPHGVTMTQFDASLNNAVLHGHLHLSGLEPSEVLPRASLQVVPSDPRASIVLGSLPLHVKVVAVPILQHWLARSARHREGVLSDEAVNAHKTIRYTLGICSTNLDPVFLAFSETNHLALSLRSSHTTALHPVLSTSLSPFHDVVGERAASVILGNIPGHHAAFCEDVIDPERTLGLVGSNLDHKFQAGLSAAVLILSLEREGTSIGSLKGEDGDLAHVVGILNVDGAGCFDLPATPVPALVRDWFSLNLHLHGEVVPLHHDSRLRHVHSLNLGLLLFHLGDNLFR